MNGHPHQTHFAKESFKVVCGYFLYGKSTEVDRTSYSKRIAGGKADRYGM